MPLHYAHVDVFSPSPYSGNSLPVFLDAGGLSTNQMLRITQELRQFETIFLTPTLDPNRVGARVFDLFEELPFAGHPIIGAAAVLHHRKQGEAREDWTIDLPGRSVTITTSKADQGYFGLLDQGVPVAFGEVADRVRLARAHGLDEADLIPDLPVAVISTGLRYVILPVRSGVLDRARITQDNTALVQSVGAQFSVLLDEVALEIRHWNNDGLIEDIATGSAAGSIGGVNRPGFTGGQNSRRIARYGTCTKEEDVEAVFT